MSLWTRARDVASAAFGRRAKELTYDQIASLIDGTYGGAVGGMVISDKTALQVSTVLACVRAIADGCATPRLNLYRKNANGRRELATNVPEFRMLARRPNEWQTSFEWRRMMTMHAALCGSALSIKVRGGNGRTRELIPVMPGRWEVRKTSRYDLRYRCWDEYGQIGDFAPDEVFLLHNMQWDWASALNVVSLARNIIGLAALAERSHVAFHENGVRPSGIYSVEGTLDAEQHERLSANLKKQAGAARAGLPMVLDRAAKWVSTAMTGVDAQHVETRRLQIAEVCRAFGVMPVVIGHSDTTSTFASTEAFFGAHLKLTLTPWHVAWEQRIDETLLDGAGPLWVEFDTQYLTAGSMKDRAAWMRVVGELGVRTRNELREEDGKDPLPGLDEPLAPVNLAPSTAPNKEPAGEDPQEDD